MRDEHFFIAELLQKYPDLNQEEREQLNRWLEEGNNKDFFNPILDKHILEEDLRQLNELKIESEHSWDKLLQFRSEQKKKARIFWLNSWKTYVAAASVVVLLGIGGVMLYQSRKANHPIVQGKESQAPGVTDVNPGQYKAKLTLADGSVVVLDSFSNAKLVQQGSTNVYTKDGQLVYKPQGNKSKEVLYNKLATAKGETFGMTLSDGSQVWLNSQSSIRYPVAFNSDIRKVEITGEAYFEVAAISRKTPFIVSLNGTEVEVLGTHFNINSYVDEPSLKTTLLEGKVRVRSADNTQIILEPGEQAILRKSEDDKTVLSKTKEVDVDAEVAWRFGNFLFNNADLKTVMRQMARWYDVEIEYKGAAPARKFVGSIPRSLSLSKVLMLLEKQNVHFTIEGKKIIVTP